MGLGVRDESGVYKQSAVNNVEGSFGISRTLSDSPIEVVRQPGENTMR